jgi:hypothetical protein
MSSVRGQSGLETNAAGSVHTNLSMSNSWN